MVETAVKKNPVGQLHEPSLLLVAEATHDLQSVALLQLAHPEEQGVQIPFKSKNPTLQIHF